jgi:hypothetical protein
MRHAISIAAFAALAAGANHFYSYMNKKKKRRLQEKKLEVWEGEGGAVPVAPGRTAAQISPRKVSGASPSGDASHDERD